MRITVANNKGGTGKTTTSLFLATAAHHNGHTPLVLDTDYDNATAERWANVAENDGDPLPFPVRPANVLGVKRNYPGHDLVFIDTPGATGKMFDAAIGAADLIILPTNASVSDASTTMNVVADIEATNKNHAPILILVTRQRNGTKAAGEIIKHFADSGYAVVDFAIPLLESINQAYGSTPTELKDYGRVWELLESIYLDNE